MLSNSLRWQLLLWCSASAHSVSLIYACYCSSIYTPTGKHLNTNTPMEKLGGTLCCSLSLFLFTFHSFFFLSYTLLCVSCSHGSLLCVLFPLVHICVTCCADVVMLWCVALENTSIREERKGEDGIRWIKQQGRERKKMRESEETQREKRERFKTNLGLH